jgi:glycosyltransferase involved in cell wall biosynthesis
MHAAFSKAHFILVPSAQEPCALVFSEACAYGVPILTSDVGGVRTAVEDHVNGRLLPANQGAESFARIIVELLHRSSSYTRLCEGARHRFETILNWEAAAGSMKDAVEGLGLYRFS